MKRCGIVVATIVLVAGLATWAMAQQRGSAPKSKPGAMVVVVSEWSGKITAVDTAKRTVTLEGANDRVATVNAKNARNLDQGKVGDTVKIRYAEALAIYVRKADAAPQATEAKAVELAPKGQKPGGIVADTVAITRAVVQGEAKPVVRRKPDAAAA